MGMAVIALSVTVRILMLPLTIKSRATEEDKERIGRLYTDLKRRFKSSDPLRYQNEKSKLVRREKSMIRSEMINLGIQIFIALMLWRVFSTGLKGHDLHLLYHWVPEPDLPFNLIFLKSIDLSKPSLQLNLLASLLLFILEVLQVMFSPFEPTVNDRLMQIIVPVGVFLYLYRMPGGKKLFVITSSLFSLLMILIFEGWDLMVAIREQEV